MKPSTVPICLDKNATVLKQFHQNLESSNNLFFGRKVASQNNYQNPAFQR